MIEAITQNQHKEEILPLKKYYDTSIKHVNSYPGLVVRPVITVTQEAEAW